jgi:hypothetical protein
MCAGRAQPEGRHFRPPGMSDFAEFVAALAMFGLVVIVPLVFMLMKHQKAMAELIHRQPSHDAEQRIAALEREVMDLRAYRQEQILRDLEQRELGNRIQQ